MHFNLNELFENTSTAENEELLKNLEIPFTEEEVLRVIKELPNGKSPGPDGFNNEFIKSCWDIIRTDMMQLIHDF